ncbi:hypothetical protein GCM10007424_17100 [Flavobacterium suaedae]|uniref:Uncharacterized protein n=1 Tax=Flavobacterium suaedae TaxID=1767027 RepID=A0ABQ1JY34_9FLAO|nr:hypothetical protein [Flavobacterium suaedae]GGB77608.1 hypothetical protein GCM10007424_17100 [Flavobacterium suaedae]
MNKNKAPKKITAAQMERLFRFTREHFVEHYDLQAELADHLANAIEERWVQNSGLDFEEALQAEFKKFGVFGFSDIVEKRQNALTKKYYKLLWGYFKNFLHLPQFLGTFTAVAAVYVLLQLSPYIYILFLFSIMVVSIIKLFKLKKGYNKKVKQSGHRWLLEDIIFSCGGFGSMLYLPIQLSLHIYEEREMSALLTPVLAILIVAIILFEYVALYILPNKAQKHLLETYPEYSIIEE